MELTVDSIKAVVHESLNQHYSTFAAKPDTKLVDDITALLSDASKGHVDAGSSFESDAAYQARMLLLRTFSHGLVSVKCVVNIFNKLDRTNELGWLTG